jgi:RNA polymerase sigma-70 factor (ECF subfamily)
MRYDQATDAERWVDRHGDCLYRYALLRLRTPELAADVVQETFLEALGAQGSFQGRSSERTWLIGILRHKILDHFRKSGREQALLGLGAEAEVEVEPRAAGLEPGFDPRGRWKTIPGSWTGEPSRVLETREFWDVFGRCLARLPRGLADAFFLREVDGLKAEEVQELLGISPANLWARLCRARAQLRRCLEIGWFNHDEGSPPSC